MHVQCVKRVMFCLRFACCVSTAKMRTTFQARTHLSTHLTAPSFQLPTQRRLEKALIIVEVGLGVETLACLSRLLLLSF